MPSLPIADYAPWGNAHLMFEVSNNSVSIDSSTGNPVTGTTVLEYLAALVLSSPNWQKQEGADMTTYQCKGRLLFPQVLDGRITNGTQAKAVINGYQGRFELVFDLSMDSDAYSTVRQSIQGTFRVIGGKPVRPVAP